VEGREGRAVAGASARALAVTLRVLGVAACAAWAAWSALALWFDGPASRLVAGLAAVALLAAVGTALARSHPLRRGLALVPCMAVLAWWLEIQPSNDRAWLPDVARAPTAVREAAAVTIRDVRNFDYRSETDFVERWETRRYEAARLRGLDLFLSYWGPTLYAHTILSFDFAGAAPLAVSIETRKERGESYSALRGFFRQYELVYVMADERDVVRLRASFRGERVFLYRLTTPPEAARALFDQYLEEANVLARRPAWYNAFSENCTTGIWRNARAIAPETRFDWRLLLNGSLDALLYERGLVDRRLPFAELRARSEITETARGCADRADFSSCIRADLPRPPAREARAAPARLTLPAGRDKATGS
jgi:Domain of unknown function (DUF4105)